MSIIRKIKNRTQRRALRVRTKIKATMPRVSVFKSSTHMYAQIIDDNAQKTLVSCSTLELKNNAQGNKVEKAFKVGQELAQRARAQGINKVIFDRGQFLYHGRIKALAEGLREGGIVL